MLLLKIASGLRNGRPCFSVFADEEDGPRQYLFDYGFYRSQVVDDTELRTLTEKGKQWLENYQRKNAPCS